MALSNHQSITAAIGVTLVMILFIAVLAKLAQQRPAPGSGGRKNISGGNIKKTNVAGSFYPAGAAELSASLEKYTNAAQTIPHRNPYRILIVPHAGLDYSGPTAGTGYKQVMNGPWKRVVIIGPSHYMAFEGAALSGDGWWETPLGNVKTDGTWGARLASNTEKIQVNNQAFEKEHSIEIQAVWIKKVLPDAEIVPILVSTPTPEQSDYLAGVIAANLDSETLVVISTDLSHYPEYETANITDRKTIDAILEGKTENIKNNPPGVETTACGYEALLIAQKIAKLTGADRPVLLKYQNSGDVTGTRDRVVGYAAIAVTGAKNGTGKEMLDESAREEALAIARKTLTDYVTGGKKPEKPVVTNTALNSPLGAFVTLTKNGQLRGCIGEFEPTKPLYQVIVEKTIAAASEDPRFSPVTAGELPQIEIEISVLTNRTKISDWHEIRPGTDGVVIVSGSKTGTFLPQVASDNNWGLEQMLSELCRQKIGLPANCYLSPSTEFYTYQAQVFDQSEP